MKSYTIEVSERLAQAIEELAEREHRTPENALENILDLHFFGHGRRVLKGPVRGKSSPQR